MTDTKNLSDLAKRIRTLQILSGITLNGITKVQAGHFGPCTDDEILDELANSIIETRKHFNLEGGLYMHGVYEQGADHIYCHTGLAPGSSYLAMLITLLINNLDVICELLSDKDLSHKDLSRKDPEKTNGG